GGRDVGVNGGRRRRRAGAYSEGLAETDVRGGSVHPGTAGCATRRRAQGAGLTDGRVPRAGVFNDGHPGATPEGAGSHLVVVPDRGEAGNRSQAGQNRRESKTTEHETDPGATDFDGLVAWTKLEF